jgi:hypothetical protein
MMIQGMKMMKFNYKDLLIGVPCCDNCDRHCDVEFDNKALLYCPEQEQIVSISGYCDAYDGFWSTINR